MKPLIPEQKNFKSGELQKIEFLLSCLPPRHLLRHGEQLSLRRENYLQRKGVTYLSVGGIGVASKRAITLFSPAFWGMMPGGQKAVPVLDLTLYTLIGALLFQLPPVFKGWSTLAFPKFNKGRGGNGDLFLLDRHLVMEDFILNCHDIWLNQITVSLEESFALLYAAYLLCPQQIFNAYPNCYCFLREKIFDGREYKRASTPLSGAFRLVI